MQRLRLRACAGNRSNCQNSRRWIFTLAGSTYRLHPNARTLRVRPAGVCRVECFIVLAFVIVAVAMTVVVAVAAAIVVVVAVVVVLVGSMAFMQTLDPVVVLIWRIVTEGA